MLLNFHKNNQLMLVLKPSLPTLLTGVLFSVFSGVLGLFSLWCVIQLIGGHSGEWLFFATLFWFGSALFSASSAWISHFSEAQFSATLRRQVATHLTRLPAHQFVNYKNDKLKRLLGEDITALHHMIAHLPVEIANLLILPGLTIVFLLAETQLIALVVLLPGFLAAICYLVIIPKLTAKQAAEHFNVMAEITSAVNDYSQGAVIYRTYITNNGPLTKLKQATEYFIKSIDTRIKRVASVVALATAMLQAVATFTIAYSLGSDWPIEDLAALLFFSLAIVTPALKLGHGLDYVRAGKNAANRIEEFLDIPIIPFGKNNYSPSSIGSLVVNQLSLQITPQLAEQEINFSVTSNTLLAISGESGVGKSSLLRVLAGFEPAYLGRVSYQAEDLSTLSEESWSKLVMLLPQKLDVLDASVRDNLALTQPNATDAEYIEALEQAQLFIPLSQSAVILSGGEKQRLHLARVLLSQAPIILLDEPTSALDELTALYCIKALKHYAQAQHKIIIMITHDYKIAAQADRQLILTEKTLCGERV